jgi:hypothetical protein
LTLELHFLNSLSLSSFFFLIVLFDLEISPSTSSCVQFFFFTESSVASWEIYILIVSMSGWSTDAFKSWIGTFFFLHFSTAFVCGSAITVVCLRKFALDEYMNG